MKVGRLLVLGEGGICTRHGRLVSMTVCQCQCEKKTIVSIPTVYLKRKSPVLSCGCAIRKPVNPVEAKHKERISKGYRYVYAPDSFGANKSGSFKGYVLEHRLVMERHLGRPLQSDEEVHHIDYNPLNNSLNNLLLLRSSEHARLHAEIKKKCVLQQCYNKQTLKRIAKEKSPHRKCIDCGKDISALENSSSTVKRCVVCAALQRRIAKRPEKDVLEQQLKGNTLRGVGRHYGVSDSAVKKWAISYGIDYKSLIAPVTISREAMEKSHSAEARRKTSETLKKWHRENISSCACPVLCYDKKMNLIKEYRQISDARIDGFLDSPISKCCKGKIKTYKGFLWRYKSKIISGSVA